MPDVVRYLPADLPRSPRELVRRARPTAAHVARLTVASVLGYLLTAPLQHGPIDLTGALTALLVVQASTRDTLQMGLVRVGAVVTGILVAIALTTVVGLTWWSLGIAIATSLVLAKVLHLGDQALETPISAMLILGVGGADVAWETRLVTTLVGTAVGIGLNLLVPPAVPVRPAIGAVRRVTDAVAAPLRAASVAFAAGPPTRDDVDVWLDETRAASRHIADATDALLDLKTSRRYNSRAIGRADVEPVLRTGLDTLDAANFASRSLLLAVINEIPPGGREDVYGEQVREAFAVVLEDLAESVEAFGELVAAEAQGREVEAEHRLEATLDVVGETRAILTELLFVDGRANPSLWLLRGSVLGAVEEVLRVLDPGGRSDMLAAWKASQAGRRVSSETGTLRVIGVDDPRPDDPTSRVGRTVMPRIITRALPRRR